MFCPTAEVCRKVRRFKESSETEVPLPVNGEINILLNDPFLLKAVHACISSHPGTCYLSTENINGSSTSLNQALKPLQP
jgi:hypothetical protein